MYHARLQISWLVITAIIIAILVLIGFLMTKSGLDIYSLNATPTQELISLTSTETAFYHRLQVEWLTSIPCSPPCWGGITPGQTTSNEVFRTLTENELANDINSYPDTTTKTGEITWEWKVLGKPGGRIFYDSDSQTVIVIWPNLGCCISLGDVVSAYGQPDYVVVTEVRNFDTNPSVPSSKYYTFTFVWLAHGIMFQGSLGDGKPLTEDLSLASPSFFVPSLDGYLRQIQIISIPHRLFEWCGYNDYEKYLIKYMEDFQESSEANSDVTISKCHP